MPTIPSGPYAAVLGSPIAHSLSPALHRAAYQVLGLDWSYEKFEVSEAGLSNFLDSLHGDCRGLSLTMPLKDSAYSVATFRDEAAVQTRACNTLLKHEGVWHGFNTDVQGFVTAFERGGVTSLDGAIVLGAGATARSALAALLRLGVRNVDVVARRSGQVLELAELFPEVAIRARTFGDELDEHPVLVSTLPATAADDVLLPPTVELVFDVVYAPWPTQLARSAQGRQVLGGLDLLVGQAVEQVLLMTMAGEKHRAEIFEAMYSAGLAEQVRRSA